VSKNNFSTKNNRLNIDNLTFRRQYFISNTIVNIFPTWSCTQITSNSFLYTHPDLEISTFNIKSSTICVVGYCFYPSEGIHDNASTIASLVGTSETSDALIKSFSKACGRYVVFVKNQKEYCAFADPVSLRTVYYNKDHTSIVTVASDINIFKHISPQTVTKELRTDAVNFYKHEFKLNGDGNAWIGDETIYNNIYKLLPNTILDINRLNMSRYWPKKPIENNSTEYVADKAAEYLKAVLKQAKSRQKLSIAITAGYDSRIMVAATYHFKDSIQYFIDKHEYMGVTHPDIVISQSIAKKLNLNFTVNNQTFSSSHVPLTFKNIYYNNTFYAGEKRLSTVYFYYNKYNTYLNVCGVGEIGRTRFGQDRFPVSPERLSYKYGYINSPYATKAVSKWYANVKIICKNMNLNPFTLFYWENDLGNWGSVGNCESDIAIEEFNPFNSHYLLELLLSAPNADTKCTENKVFDLIIEKLCPQIADIPINPGFTLAGKIKKELKKEPVFTILDYFLYIFKTNLAHVKKILNMS